MMSCICVLVANGHPITQDGIHTALEKASDISPIGRAASGQEVLALVDQHQPDILLLSLHLPESSPIELVSLLHQQSPQTKVVIFDNLISGAQARELAELGIAGYVLKEEDPETLIHALRTVSRGDTWVSQPIAALFLPRPAGETDPHGLTTQELAILRLVVAEKKDLEIAQALNLSERTVCKYLRAIYDKLGVDTRAGASYEAGRLRLFDE
jgi:two-component system, NarL family, response regulator